MLNIVYLFSYCILHFLSFIFVFQSTLQPRASPPKLVLDQPMHCTAKFTLMEERQFGFRNPFSRSSISPSWCFSRVTALAVAIELGDTRQRHLALSYALKPHKQTECRLTHAHVLIRMLKLILQTDHWNRNVRSSSYVRKSSCSILLIYICIIKQECRIQNSSRKNRRTFSLKEFSKLSTGRVDLQLIHCTALYYGQWAVQK